MAGGFSLARKRFKQFERLPELRSIDSLAPRRIRGQGETGGKISLTQSGQRQDLAGYAWKIPDIFNPISCNMLDAARRSKRAEI